MPVGKTSQPPDNTHLKVAYSYRSNTHFIERSFQAVLTVAAKSLQPDGIVHGLEPQPCGVQVVEWVGLVASGFQFFTRLAAVFAEELIHGCFDPC